MTPGPPRPHGDRSEALRCWTARAPGRRPLAGRRGAPRTMRDPRCRESATAAYASTDSAWPTRADTTAKPRSRACATAANQSVVFPMPASPSMTSPEARGCRLQELGHGPELLRTAHHAGTHDSPIVSANPEFTDQVPGEQYLACLTGQVDESFSDTSRKGYRVAGNFRGRWARVLWPRRCTGLRPGFVLFASQHRRKAAGVAGRPGHRSWRRGPTSRH